MRAQVGIAAGGGIRDSHAGGINLRVVGAAKEGAKNGCF